MKKNNDESSLSVWIPPLPSKILDSLKNKKGFTQIAIIKKDGETTYYLNGELVK